VGFRIVGHGPSLRIECRIPGADANPYAAYAALIAAALDGIEREREPGPVFQGDAYAAQGLRQVPTSLPAAIAELEKSAFARAAFGAEVVEHWLHFARTEQRDFDCVVTDHERRRFFERI
jgi:glutamine synthetase